MDNYMISFMILLVSIFTARIIYEKANKKLTPEKKVELIDLFSKSRILTLGVLIVIIGIYFLALKYQIFEPVTSMIIYLSILLIFIIYNSKKAYDKLNANDFPDDLIKSFLLSTVVRFVGIIVFCAILMR